MLQIPKKIHYIWLSGEELSKLAKLCIASWKRHCPDYEIILWDMERCKNTLGTDSVLFVKEAMSLKKWAFASDYIRLFAVYSEGGIYMDSDVYLYQNLDGFLKNEYFTNIEWTEKHFKKHKSAELINADGTKKADAPIALHGLALQAAIFGARAGHPFLKSCMNYYENSHFILPDGKLNTENISPFVYAHIAQEYGFLYKDVLQKLKNGVVIYPSNVFLPSFTESQFKPFAIHCTTGSWRGFAARMYRKIKRILLGDIERQLERYESKLYPPPPSHLLIIANTARQSARNVKFSAIPNARAHLSQGSLARGAKSTRKKICNIYLIRDIRLQKKYEFA